MPSTNTRPQKPPEEPRDEVIEQIVEAYIRGVEALPPDAQRVANRVLQEPILGEVVSRFFQKHRATDEELVLGRLSVEDLYSGAKNRKRLAVPLEPRDVLEQMRTGDFDTGTGGGTRIKRKSESES